MAPESRRKVSLNPFSPWRSTADSLQRTLVGRDHIIKDILEKTQRFCKGAPAKHCLIIGRRGLGKTHVIVLLFHYYEKNCIIPEFESISNDVLPIFLLEEERYSLNSLALFLMKIFEKFTEKSPGETKWDIPQYLDSDEDVIEYCFEKLKNISMSEKKKILILCDNLEEVFKQWQEKEYKILRAFLSDQQSIMIIGTAVKIFREIISPKQPFYEFFETVPLPDLSDSQMVELLKKRFSEDNLGKEFNRKEKYLKNKVAAISKLTGGNPRLVVFLYDIVTKKNVFEIEDAIEELMESLNEYFRNRFSDLAPQERTILDAFADMDGPATPKEISKKTRIKEQSTYAHVKKLKDAGYIDSVEFAKHKISRYDVTERLFRLWRQTATISGRKKFQILIRFLKLYFTPEELKEDFLRSIKQLDYAFHKNRPKNNGNYIQDQHDLNFKIMHSINRACVGEFGYNMEGLAGKIANEKLEENEIKGITEFIFGIMERCLVKSDIQTVNGLYMTLLKLNEWHKINEVQEIIALYLRKLVDIKNRELFINSVSLANEHISDKDLLELIKAFLYAGRYLKEGNKVILEEVFPEIREIIFDIIEKLGKAT
jgi:DNA-binding MarR family transcriptional regulator